MCHRLQGGCRSPLCVENICSQCFLLNSPVGDAPLSHLTRLHSDVDSAEMCESEIVLLGENMGVFYVVLDVSLSKKCLTMEPR